MGGDIAIWCALKGYTVTLQDQQNATLARVMQRAHGLFRKRLKDRLLVQAAMDRLIPDTRGNGLRRDVLRARGAAANCLRASVAAVATSPARGGRVCDRNALLLLTRPGVRCAGTFGHGETSLRTGSRVLGHRRAAHGISTKPVAVLLRTAETRAHA